MTPPVLDAHTHAFPDQLAPHAVKSLTAGARSYPVRAHLDGTAAALQASMDRAGIAQAIVCSVATRPGQVKSITDFCASIASDRLIPFASIHPDYPDPEAEVARIASLGLRGLKFHPQYMNCPADDPRTIRLARAAADAHLAFTIHAGHDLAFDPTDIASPRRIRALHDAVPTLRLLACHLGGWRQWEEALDHVVGRPIYLETSFCLGQCPSDLLHRILTSHPPDFLLFGSDSPWASQDEELKRFTSRPLPPHTLTHALSTNARRFLGNSD